MIIRTTEIKINKKYSVNGMEVLAQSHQDAVRKWLDIIFGKTHKKNKGE